MLFLLLFGGAAVVVALTKWAMTPSPKFGTVIILNGPSCVGKSSVVKAIQNQGQKLWLEAGIDKLFVGIIAEKYFNPEFLNHDQVMSLTHSVDELNNPVVSLNIGPEGQKIVAGWHSSIAAYAKAGCNLVVDYIAYQPTWRTELLAALAGLKVIKVGINAPLEVIEAREAARQTSPKGHSRSHYHQVHEGWQYDLFIDNTELTAEQIANEVLALAEK